jgi:hypothetical protein
MVTVHGLKPKTPDAVVFRVSFFHHEGHEEHEGLQKKAFEPVDQTP